MTLEVAKNGEITIYSDEAKLPIYRWEKIFGVTSPTITSALFRIGLRTEDAPPRCPSQPNQRLIPVEWFPYIVDGLSRPRVTGHPDQPIHDWATRVDTSQDFTVTTPKGSTLTYKYPEKS